MDKRKLKRYEIAVYLILLLGAVVLAFMGNLLSQETINAITINLASELLAVGVLFFFVNRIFLLDDDDLSNKIFDEIYVIKTALYDNFEEQKRQEQKITIKMHDEIGTIKNALHKEFEQEQKRQEQKITLILRNGARQLELPVELRRAEFTRAEILGRIGMLPMKVKGQRFSLEYLSTREFLHEINQIVASDRATVLTISCTEDEFTQFDLDRINNH